MSSQIYFNPSCSKCRSAQAILDEHHIEADVVRYLDVPPTRADLERLMAVLGIDDPRLMMRTGETVYAELALDEKGPAELLDAIADPPHPLGAADLRPRRTRRHRPPARESARAPLIGRPAIAEFR